MAQDTNCPISSCENASRVLRASPLPVRRLLTAATGLKAITPSLRAASKGMFNISLARLTVLALRPPASKRSRNFMISAGLTEPKEARARGPRWSTKAAHVWRYFFKVVSAVEPSLLANQSRSQFSVEWSSRVSPEEISTNSARIFLDAFAVNSPRRAFSAAPAHASQIFRAFVRSVCFVLRNSRRPSPPVKAQYQNLLLPRGCL